MPALTLGLLLSLLGCGQTISPAPLLTTTPTAGITPSPPPLEILFFNIGQGDATLMTGPTGKSLLIDGGPPGSGDSVRTWLEHHDQWPPSSLLATHYDLDHLGGLVELMQTPPTRPDCFDRGPPAGPPKTVVEQTYLDLRAPCRVVDATTRLDLGPVTITVLAVNGHLADGTIAPLSPDDENAHSIVLHIRYKNFTYLHMADLPGGGGTPPYDTVDLESAVAPLAGPVAVLHVGHHGSKTSTNATLLAHTMPQAAVISVGAENEYGHPHDEVIERLHKAHVTIYTTEDGHLHLTSDGNTFDIRQEPLLLSTGKGD